MKKVCSLLLVCTMLMGLVMIPAVYAEGVVTDIGSLQELGAITTSGSYRLTADLTVPENIIITIPAELTINLDLNGHSVTKASGSGRLLNNSGIMTISDSSADKKGLVSAYRNGIGNDGTMTINGGTYETQCTAGGTTVYNLAGGTMIINSCVVNASNFAVNNDGEMLINNGEFHSTSSTRNASYAYCVRNTANMTIKKATITGIQGALASASGVLSVYDGNFSTDWNDSASFYALYIAGEEDVVTGYIYGGTYSSPRSAVYIGNDNTNGDGGINAKATTYIYGGMFNGGKSAIYRAQVTGNPAVSGGTYLKNDQPDSTVENYLAQGCTYDAATGKVSDLNVYSLTLDKTSLSLTEGEKASLQATAKTGAEADKTVAWTSGDSTIATVSSTGEVTAVKAGTVTITASAGGKTATCNVIVAALPPDQDTGKAVDKIVASLPAKDAQTIQNEVNEMVGKLLIGEDVGDAVSEQTKAALTAAINAGKAISVAADIQPVSSETILPEDIKMLKAAAGETATIAQYLDISIVLKADGTGIGTLNRLGAPVKLVVTIPEALQQRGRVFYILRLHDGVAEKLPTTFVNGVATCETALFSTYALVYDDSGVAPPTGDAATTGLWVGLAVLSLVAVALPMLKRRKA